jgi:D-tyrosyl-tRNA(Tyr) deacylase
VVQRCGAARVLVEGGEVAAIGRGLVAFVGAGQGDGPDDVRYLAAKIAGLRVFEAPDGRMALGPREVGGAILLVPQFTVYGDVRRGLRPDFTAAAPAESARALLADLAAALRATGLAVQAGSFGAHMTVEVSGDGPVTILIDSQRAV